MSTQVSRATLTLQLEDALRADILSGELRPGERLRAADIAPRYGVSATPLREALQRLAVEGLVVLDARIGATVSPISRDDLRDVYDTRVVLESEALRRAIERGDGVWVGQVAIALQDLRRLTPGADLEVAHPGAEEAAKAWSAAHREFDVQLYSASGSPWLLRFIDTLSLRCERYRRAAGQLSNTYSLWLEEHEAIYQAVRSRDTAAAVAALRDHLEQAKLLLEERLAEALPVR
jgi:DNA-binding GntR family transcriptional regulator